MKFRYYAAGLGVLSVFGLATWIAIDPSIRSCATMLERGIPPVAEDRADRFLGKVLADTGDCRGGERTLASRGTPWVDWSNYWATGGEASKSGHLNPITVIAKHLERNGRGIDGALLDLERQRVELIRFNLFDNYTFEAYTNGRDNKSGRTLKSWPEMRLSRDHPDYGSVGGPGDQHCRGELIRFRNVNGICNDLRNPAMGATGMDFARNVEFESTFPLIAARLGDTIVANRHGDRISLMHPDPQTISRELFSRAQSRPEACNAGQGLPGNDVNAQCDYKTAPFFNVLAAYWIQFMTHDWFSHLEEGRNNMRQKIVVGCGGDEDAPGCTPDAQDYAAIFDRTGAPDTFDGGSRLTRSYKTSPNTVTAWWDASQIYGYDDVSRARVKRDPDDKAKLLLREVAARRDAGDGGGYLPVMHATCPADEPTCEPTPMNPKWSGQASTAFPENWSIGMSFFHTLFAREHNTFVTAFRAKAARNPAADSGLRRPQAPFAKVAYRDVTDDELFEIGRLVVAATIAKIHTIEWTTQLLYDEPLRTAMYSNWDGLFNDYPTIDRMLYRVIEKMGTSGDDAEETTWYSVFSSGAGIVGTGTLDKNGDITDLAYDNNGVNHFGSPFNFTEEFVSVYRLHPLLPDLIELRDAGKDANAVTGKLPIVSTFRNKATGVMHAHGMENLALSMGRQRLGALALQNHPAFLQNLAMPDRTGKMATLDVTALDIIRDRERGIPRFNEFRRQIGLRQLTSFSDFVDKRLADLPDKTPAQLAQLDDQRKLAQLLRDIYGQHVCDANKIISTAQRSPDGAAGGTTQSPFPNDCLGQPHGTLVDNVEDLDTIVGYLAETTRPHGFAISETQFQIFIVNASRRLFSDRFFTSSFRPEFYSTFGLDWVNNNGPDRQMERGRVNGHRQQVLPLKRVLMRNLPGLEDQLDPIINAFDPWGRDRGEYYSLDWTPIRAARDDPEFSKETP